MKVRTYIMCALLLIEPYPPMPKSILARRGRLGYDIQDICSETSEEEDFVNKKKNNPLGREGREGNLGWEPVSKINIIKISSHFESNPVCSVRN
jgi:hypothetical protein